MRSKEGFLFSSGPHIECKKKIKNKNRIVPSKCATHGFHSKIGGALLTLLWIEKWIDDWMNCDIFLLWQSEERKLKKIV